MYCKILEILLDGVLDLVMAQTEAEGENYGPILKKSSMIILWKLGSRNYLFVHIRQKRQFYD